MRAVRTVRPVMAMAPKMAPVLTMAPQTARAPMVPSTAVATMAVTMSAVLPLGWALGRLREAVPAIRRR